MNSFDNIYKIILGTSFPVYPNTVLCSIPLFDSTSSRGKEIKGNDISTTTGSPGELLSRIKKA